MSNANVQSNTSLTHAINVRGPIVLAYKVPIVVVTLS